MGGLVLPPWQRRCAWTALALIVAANSLLVKRLLVGE
jgi:hypothetical protein